MTFGLIQCLADACVFRLMYKRIVVMSTMVKVDDTDVVGEKARCDQFGWDRDQKVQIENLGELRWCSGCFYRRY